MSARGSRDRDKVEHESGMSVARTAAAAFSDQAAQVARRFSLEHLPPGFHDDPYPVYAALREHDPVHLLPGGQLFVTRYSDVERIYKDPRTFSSDKVVEFGAKYGRSPLFDHHTTSLVFNDPPL